MHARWCEMAVFRSLGRREPLSTREEEKQGANTVIADREGTPQLEGQPVVVNMERGDAEKGRQNGSLFSLLVHSDGESLLSMTQ